MKITFEPKFWIAYIAAVFVFGQLHEMSHLTAAYIVCGEPGVQNDFNLWMLSSHCEASAYLPTIFGPAFSYLCMWTGSVLLYCRKRSLWPVGIILILVNLPFARLFTAGMGGGDETTVLKVLLPGYSPLLVKVVGFVVVSGFSLPPLIMVYRRLQATYKVGILSLLCVGPMVIMMLYEFKLLGWLLHSGFLSDRHFLGIADLIHLHTAVMAGLVIYYRQELFTKKAPVIERYSFI